MGRHDAFTTLLATVALWLTPLGPERTAIAGESERFEVGAWAGYGRVAGEGTDGLAVAPAYGLDFGLRLHDHFSVLARLHFHTLRLNSVEEITTERGRVWLVSGAAILHLLPPEWPVDVGLGPAIGYGEGEVSARHEGGGGATGSEQALALGVAGGVWLQAAGGLWVGPQGDYLAAVSARSCSRAGDGPRTCHRGGRAEARAFATLSAAGRYRF